MNWRIRTTNYKIVETLLNTYRVMKVVSYFGISWSSEFVSEEFYDLSSARSFINICKDTSIEIKYL